MNESEFNKKTLVLGLGNDILTDDAIGLNVVRQVRRLVEGWENVEVQETTEMGLALLDFIVGFHRLLLVDSIQTGRVPAGFVHEFEGADLSRLPGPTPHFLGVGETLALGRELGLAMPEQVKVIAIEVEDPFTLGTQMTAALEKALPQAVERVMAELRR